MRAKDQLAAWVELEVAVAATNISLKKKLIRYSKASLLFCLATFSLIGYQNCMGQKVDLSSSTPGASEVAACAPSTTDLSNFASPHAEMQTNCVGCHGDTSNSASAVFRLYTSSSDANAESDNFCSLQAKTLARVKTQVIDSSPHPIHITISSAPSLYAYLSSM